MNGWKWEIVLASLAVGLLLAELATAQDQADAVSPPEYFAETTEAGFEFDAYYAQEPPEEIPAGDLVDGMESSCDCGVSQCQGGCSDEAWRLLPCKIGCGIDVRGWVAAGATTHESNNASRFSGPVTFNDREEFLLNQLYLSIEKAIDNGGCGWGLGGRVDLLYGTDHRFTMARGLETQTDLDNRWNSSRFYGLALPQAYMEVAHDNLSVKLGHFYTILGYETVMAPDNFFYSHAYTMQYAEPFTHTGLLASWDHRCEGLTFHAGFDRGWDNWEDDEHGRLSYLAGASLDNGCGTTLAFSGTIGQEPNQSGQLFGTRYAYSVVASHELGHHLTYVLQHDWGWQDQGASATEDAEWYGFNQYLFCKLNCQWTAGMRFEWFRDDDGARVTGLQTGNPIQGDRFAGNFWALALGANYKHSANLLFRPEVRYDWFDGDGIGTNNQPFGDGNDASQFTAACDLIFTF